MAQFTKIIKKLTPSGLWNDGLYGVSEEKLNIPNDVYKTCIVEDIFCKGVGDAMQITSGNMCWIVKKN